MKRPLRIAFVHPDLGLGGSERLVVDAAVCLQRRGHQVTIFTSRHHTRSFEETLDGTLEVRSYGRLLPMHIADRLRAPCTILRTCYTAARLRLSPDHFDVVFCDLVSASIPVLKIFSPTPVVFYCHYPDLLLVPHRREGVYRWYRMPIDRLEEITTGMADRVLVNSRFTAAAVRRTFPGVDRLAPEVLYPGVDVARYREVPDECGPGESAILSLNRYAFGKNVRLAVEALAALRGQLSPGEFGSVRLIVAGGFDLRLKESHDTLAELQRIACERALEQHVTFLKSVSDEERMELFARARCVVHTSENEHFGYVPIEAMAAGRPVVAVNNGGPAETIVHGVTGFLCAPTADGFAEALAPLIRDDSMRRRMGRAAREHVATNFSREKFAERLEGIVRDLTVGAPT